MTRTPDLQALLRGAVAGAGATLPMSAVMLAAERASGGFRQPPEAIVRRAGELAGHEPRGAVAGGLASLAHLGFGVALGAVLPLLPARGSTPARALALSLGVYAASYQGWVPGLGALPPASRDRGDRQGTLLVAHVVYGLALGVLHDRLGSVPAHRAGQAALTR